MKKVILLFFILTLYLVPIHGQSTNDNYKEPAKYEFLYAGEGRTSFRFLLDSQTGKLTLISGWLEPENIYVVNDKDLTNGTPTRNGRFRITQSIDDSYPYLTDTEEGRVWIIKIQKYNAGNPHKAKGASLQQVLPEMAKPEN